jgi:2-polyprenyl-6-methoxyphenol hydroxylase-like FAD-dependent oxidoreductase
LSSIGIRRWRLQKLLADTCIEEGIPILMNTRINSVSFNNDKSVNCHLGDGKTIRADLLFGCDGVKSAIRTSLFSTSQDVEPKYTGITCLMGSG